jgi:hypothetical protein
LKVKLLLATFSSSMVSSLEREMSRDVRYLPLPEYADAAEESGIALVLEDKHLHRVLVGPRHDLHGVQTLHGADVGEDVPDGARLGEVEDNVTLACGRRAIIGIIKERIYDIPARLPTKTGLTEESRLGGGRGTGQSCTNDLVH